jgi:RNA polymerase sigma-70 factor (ECF subfamily)
MMAEVVDPPSEAQANPGAVNEDAARMRAVAAGHHGAFSLLYEAHRVRLFRLAQGILLDPHEAREAVQEAFLKLYEAAPRWEPIATIGTWLYRVVLNHCLSLRQRLRRLARPVLGPRRSASPEARAVAGEAVVLVERALATLSRPQRAVVCLFLEAELSPRDIAPLVHLSPGATRVALHRGLERLRAELRAGGIDSAIVPEETFSEQEEP